MTICIAAICENGNAIVGASDREYGIGFTSAEFDDAKFLPLFKGNNPGNWTIALAGTVSHATEVIGAIRRLEPEIQSRDWYDMKAAIEKAYRQVRLAKAEGEILSPRGWTLDAFQKTGSQQLPTATYANLDTRFALYDLGTSLITAGFGDDGLPCILTVTNPGVSVDHSKLGFWCVGSGSTLAQASMFNRDYSWKLSIEQAAYVVYEAKLNAERATGVGSKKTDVIVITKKRIGLLDNASQTVLERINLDLRPKEFGADHAAELVL